MDSLRNETVSVTQAAGAKARVATIWLGGCAGCHMSLLDLDERLIPLQEKISLVYGPLVDAKEFPENVDLVLVEGAVANTDNWHHLRLARERSRFLIAFGDCAVTGNVTSIRNSLGNSGAVTHRAYLENSTYHQQIPQPDEILPRLLDKVLPVHHVVPVDLFLAGCPPSADLIFYVLSELLGGRVPDLSDKLKYG